MKLFKKNKDSGFTLIELLVVISIIALLSAIILAALSSARLKAKDAAIKELAHQMQLVYASVYTSNSSYASVQNTSLGLGTDAKCTTTITPPLTSCPITSTTGCHNFYTTGSNGDNICSAIFGQGSNVVAGSKDGFSTTYAVYIPYPSNISGNGNCIGSLGTVSDQSTQGSCFANGM